MGFVVFFSFPWLLRDWNNFVFWKMVLSMLSVTCFPLLCKYIRCSGKCDLTITRGKRERELEKVLESKMHLKLVNSFVLSLVINKHK